MKVLIDPDNEVYPYTFLHFAEEVEFAEGPDGHGGIEVPDEIAHRWRAARDSWRKVQAEAEAFLAGGVS
jgi:hypothetical protein